MDESLAVDCAELTANAIIQWRRDMHSVQSRKRRRANRALQEAILTPERVPICNLGAAILGISPRKFVTLVFASESD